MHLVYLVETLALLAQPVRLVLPVQLDQRDLLVLPDQQELLVLLEQARLDLPEPLVRQ